MAHFFTNHQKSFTYIKKIIDEFYEIAKNDIIIGYHFRHIENFDTHLPKIYQFWALQLLRLNKTEKVAHTRGTSTSNLIEKHLYLKIKKGEVGRWVLLFQQVLEKNINTDNDLKKLNKEWVAKTERFHQAFLNSKKLFP